MRYITTPVRQRIKSLIVLLCLIQICWFLPACKTRPNPRTIFPQDRRTDTLALQYDSLGSPMVRVEINGRTYDFLFDTGAHTTLLDEEIPAYERLGDVYFTDVFEDTYSAQRVSIDTMRLGSVRFCNLDRYHQRNIKYDGILGGNILRRLAWKIDFENRKIIAAPSGSSFGVNDAGGIPFRLQKSHPWFVANINGVPMTLMLDTGFDGFVTISSHWLDSVPGLKEEAIAWHGISRGNNHNPFLAEDYMPKRDSTWHAMATFQAGSTLLDREMIRFANLHKNLAGLDFLMRFDHVIIDYPRRKLYLGKEQAKSFNYLHEITKNLNTLGIQLSNDSIPLILRLVHKSSIKQLHEQVRGLRIGDTVASINGISFLGERKKLFGSDVYPRKSSIAKIPGFEMVPAYRDIIISNINHSVPHSEIDVKRGDSTWKVHLVRHYSVTRLPDQVRSYTGIPKGFPYVTNGGNIEFGPGSAQGTFKPRQPPLRPLGKENLPDWTQIPTYYY